VSDAVKGDSRAPTTRSERARLTRRRIIAAAAELFLDRGYGATMLDQVAERAGVAVQTVYFHFGNKATLLKHALDIAAVGDDEPVPLLQRPWMDRIHAESDPVRIIELWVANSRSIMERVAPLLAVIRGTIGADPDLAAQWHVNERQRRTAFGAFAEFLADHGALKGELTRQDAADLAFLIDSVESYFLATGTLGWSPERWERITVSMLTSTLLRTPGTQQTLPHPDGGGRAR
jgi:AcrR family transcriptional regulator